MIALKYSTGKPINAFFGPKLMFRWLDDRGGIEKNLLTAACAALFAGATGQAAEAERWADVIDRWQDQDAAQPGERGDLAEPGAGGKDAGLPGAGRSGSSRRIEPAGDECCLLCTGPWVASS